MVRKILERVSKMLKSKLMVYPISRGASVHNAWILSESKLHLH